MFLYIYGHIYIWTYIYIYFEVYIYIYVYLAEQYEKTRRKSNLGIACLTGMILIAAAINNKEDNSKKIAL